MKVKTLVILLIVLAALAGVGVLVLMQHAPGKGRRELGAPLMKGFPVNDIASVTILETVGDGVKLVKVGTRWVVKNRFGYPADFSKITGFVRKVMDAKVGRKFEASQGALKRLHLKDPEDKGARNDEKGVSIIFKDSKGKTLARLIFGKAMKGGQEGIFPEGQYVMLDNQKTVYLIDKQFEGLAKTPSEWIKKDLINVKAPDIREISCLEPDGKTISYAFRRPEKGKDLAPLHLPPGKKIKRSSVNRLAGALSSLRIEDVLDPVQDERSIGMEHSSKLEYRLFDGMIYDLYPGKQCKEADFCYLKVAVRYEKPASMKKGSVEKPGKGEERKKAKSSEEDMEQKAKALNKELGRWVYKIPQWKHDALVTDLKSLLEKAGNKGKR